MWVCFNVSQSVSELSYVNTGVKGAKGREESRLGILEARVMAQHRLVGFDASTF